MHEFQNGNIYESLVSGKKSQKIWVVGFGSGWAACIPVENDAGQWINKSKVAKRIKIRSLLPTAKLYRLIGSKPLPCDRWGTQLSVQISYISGTSVQEWRKKNHLKTRDFAALVGCTQRAVQKWESGQNEVPRLLISLLELLEMTDGNIHEKFAQHQGVMKLWSAKVESS